MKTYIIDALNVINYSQSLKTLLNSSKDNAVSGLCSELSQYLQKYPSYKFIVVVDGSISQINKFHKNVTVISSQNNTADNKIKEIFSNLANKNLIEIVSTDTEVYNYARMNSAGALTSSDFLNLIKTPKNDNVGNSKQVRKASNKKEKPSQNTKKDMTMFKELFAENPISTKDIY